MTGKKQPAASAGTCSDCYAQATVAVVLQAHTLSCCTEHTYELDCHKLTVGLIPTKPSHSKVAAAYVSYLQQQ
jgi:hypothetical protein